MIFLTGQSKPSPRSYRVLTATLFCTVICTMTDREKMVRERVAIFSAELGYSVACIAACGLVDSVLGHCWSFEEENLSDDWNEGVEQIRILERMLGT